tara:strand:- start:5087 stop:6493 length:1407 start_codon:yes stop_codon:yes gene_type:complete
MKKNIIKQITFNENEKISKVINVFNKTAKFTESKGFGLVINKFNKCIGVITDGDIRRSLAKSKNEKTIKKVFNKKFLFAQNSFSKTAILQIFEKLIYLKNYHQLLPLLNNKNKVIDLINYSDFLSEDKKPQCIRVKIPARISFVGGGTDFNEYLLKNKSYILSAAIQKFLTVSLYPRTDNKITINNHTNKKYLIFENSEKLKNYKRNDLIINLLKNKLVNSGFDLEIFSDFEPKTGLGGSSILSLAILKVLNIFKNKDEIDDYVLINEAYKSERLDSKIKGGWQDYLSSISGGFNWIDLFQSDFYVNKLNLDKKIQLELENNLVLIRVGKRKNSGLIQEKKVISFLKNPKPKIEKFNKIRSLSIEMKNYLIKGELNKFGLSMHKSWNLKKKLSPNSTSKKIDKIYEVCRKNGALGGKLLGAGQSGYLLLYVNSSEQFKLKMELQRKNSKLDFERINFSSDGLKYWKIF